MIVGLGNPGPKYEVTRHNIGFLFIDYVIDEMKESWSIDSNLRKNFKSLCFTGSVKGKEGPEKVLFLKPETFMNLSGQAVAEAARFYQIEPKDIVVIHDDLDLPLDQLRIKQGGSAGGHKGLKSIDECLGSKDYWRFRLGIGRPVHKGQVIDFVLQPFTEDECAGFDHWFKRVGEALDLMLKNEQSKAMTLYNRPPKVASTTTTTTKSTTTSKDEKLKE